jgi:acyl carrier protein
MNHAELSGQPEDELPQDEMEELVASVWTAVLGVTVSSRYDDFFLLGGSSMGAVRVSADLANRLGFAVPARSVYENTELAELAARLTQLRESRATVR